MGQLTSHLITIINLSAWYSIVVFGIIFKMQYSSSVDQNKIKYYLQ